MTSPSPTASTSQPTASANPPRAYPAYIRINPPRRDFFVQLPSPSLSASQLELHQVVEASKINVLAKEEEFESRINRLHFLQDAFRRQSPEVIRHGRECVQVLGKDKVTRNLFAEHQIAAALVKRAEHYLQFQEDKLRQNEARLAGEEGSE